MARRSLSVPKVQISHDTTPCETKNRNVKFAVEDGDKALIIDNPERKEICKTRIDDCVVKHGKRADWAVSQDGVGHVIIEFKGHNLAEAYDQICETSTLWRSIKASPKERIGALILCNRVPKAPRSTDLQLKYAKQHRGQLKVRSHFPGIHFSMIELIRADQD